YSFPAPRPTMLSLNIIYFSDDHNSGVIRFEVDKVSTLDFEGRFSPELEVGGVPWRATTCKSNDGLSVYLNSMVKQGTPWSIDVNAQFVLVNSDSCKNVTFTRIKTFDQSDYYWGGFLLNWEDVIDEEKGFVRDDKINIEIHFTIANMRGIRTASRIHFSDPNEPRHDITLVIDGEKIYVNKGILALHSPVFKAMLFGNFNEKDKKEIEVKDVDRKEFVELLQLIYPSCKKITDDSAEYLLKLGDRFQITVVITMLEEFLISSDKVSNIDKLRIADKYRLFGLK
ncbi:hypothetical protein PENTCL1PPCAC_23833, partial [Pristionchus entomophagus]